MIVAEWISLEGVSSIARRVIFLDIEIRKKIIGGVLDTVTVSMQVRPSKEQRKLICMGRSGSGVTWDQEW